ncbi:hypothetical protein SteCoe_12635 [Stentor coeruleus]|uniref:Uncharacterized protein n=1 Tax=Stentor coeruleus TaxID=5963 RepID=A0A1R2CAB3_9CILI|nr:hypothetical protein SteCoe_12635 [Stentor coeruleus]
MNPSNYTKPEKVSLSQNCFFLIDAFLFNADSLLAFRCYDLRNLFYQTITELFLSEVEILVWLIYIEEIGIKVNSCNVKEFLIFVGLHAKLSLGSDSKECLENFKEKNPRIIEKFEAWSDLIKVNSHVSTVKLAKKYRELSSFRGIGGINYNFYLNDILRSCTIYQKQTSDAKLDFYLEVEKSYSKENIFEIKKKSKRAEDQEYDLEEFHRIDN